MGSRLKARFGFDFGECLGWFNEVLRNCQELNPGPQRYVEEQPFTYRRWAIILPTLGLGRANLGFPLRKWQHCASSARCCCSD